MNGLTQKERYNMEDLLADPVAASWIRLSALKRLRDRSWKAFCADGCPGGMAGVQGFTHTSIRHPVNFTRRSKGDLAPGKKREVAGMPQACPLRADAHERWRAAFTWTRRCDADLEQSAGRASMRTVLPGGERIALSDGASGAALQGNGTPGRPAGLGCAVDDLKRRRVGQTMEKKEVLQSANRALKKHTLNHYFGGLLQ